MRWLYAPDSYGGFLSAPAAVARRHPSWLAHPMSDGGEGLLDTLRWHDPRLTPAGPAVLSAPDAFIVESARLIGPHPGMASDPLDRTSAPLGALLLELLASGRPVIVGLGGSATVDGGIGALVALGLAVTSGGRRLRRADGRSLRAPALAIEGEGPDLSAVTVWCDVTTPLAQSMACFGAQKGLDAAGVEAQGAAAAAWAEALVRWRPALSVSCPGGGAAGGLGLALAALGATLLPGAAAVADRTGLDAAIAGVGGVIVGEGRLDGTSYAGKVTGEVSARARAAGCRLAALVGQSTAAPPPPQGPDRLVLIGAERESAFKMAVRRLAAEEQT